MTKKDVEAWSTAIVVLLVLLYNAVILGFTAYVVFWMGHSGWWFLLAVLLLHSFKSKSEKEDDKD
jgi:hypothetical protein